MKTIYQGSSGKAKTLELYDRQIAKLGRVCEDRFVETSFGTTHFVVCGDEDKPPLLVFHGGNSMTSYNLLMCSFLLDHFRVFAIDIVGHPGKSAETSLPPRGYQYGQWVNEAVAGLGLTKIRCFGGSFGAGVLAKFMCVAPEKIEKCVLIVPSGINNELPFGSARMMIPLIRYRMTKDPRFVREAALFMSITDDALDQDTLDTVTCSFDCVKTKVGMPTNVDAELMNRCAAPTLVMAGELDCLFPARAGNSAELHHV
ncbi:MAG: alpha/beta hydrolase [Raoultibacter sp.]